MKYSYEIYLQYSRKLKQLAFKIFGFGFIFASLKLRLLILCAIDEYVHSLKDNYIDGDTLCIIDDLLRNKYE